MTYLLVTLGNVPREQRTNAREVEVCSEDGTIYDSRFNCPTCALRPHPRWGDS